MGELVTCIASDRVRLALEVEGNGSPLYALHGGPNNDRGGFGTYLSPIATYRRLHLLDARGCGDSQDGPLESYTIQRLAEDVEETRHQLGHEQIELLAHSFGGVAAVTYALRWPQHLRALVLVDAAFRGWRSLLTNPRGWSLWARVIAMNWQKDPDWAAFHVKHEIANQAKRDEALLFLREPHRFDPERVRRLGAAAARPLSVRPVLAAGVPVLGIYGRQDTRFLADAAHLRSVGAQLVLIDRAGHLPFLEQPEAFHKSLREFLEGN